MTDRDAHFDRIARLKPRYQWPKRIAGEVAFDVLVDTERAREEMVIYASDYKTAGIRAAFYGRVVRVSLNGVDLIWRYSAVA